uniref:C2H2-type domain-containing protein n=1 Tax=Esox lucius TaxID=8010 RepID=A0AAY5JVE2_ESOLU
MDGLLVSESGGRRTLCCALCGREFADSRGFYSHQVKHRNEALKQKKRTPVLQSTAVVQPMANPNLGVAKQASALQAHQLCHTDVFGVTEKEAKKTSVLPHLKLIVDNKTEIESVALGSMVCPQDTPQIAVTEKDPCFTEADGDAEADGTDDVHVEVISVSASDVSVRDEDESLDELNPDLELLCESDQDEKETTDVLCPIDYISASSERFNCPECFRCFTSASSLHSHKLWHREDGKEKCNSEKDIYKCDVCGFETTHRKTYHNHMRKHDDRKPYKSVLFQLGALQKNSFKCEVCGKCFSRMSALQSHQQQHPKNKPHPCSDCEKTYSNASGLYNHRKSCHTPTPTQDYVPDTKHLGFNPKKTLLGPKVFHCEGCGKGFWSLGAYVQHQQNKSLCTDLEKSKPTRSSYSVTVPPHVRGKVACPICRRKFRHQGIMKSHMRKHENGNHRCELCSKTFRMFSMKKNAYSCPDCGKLFSRAKALKFHMKSHGYE